MCLGKTLTACMLTIGFTFAATPAQALFDEELGRPNPLLEPATPAESARWLCRHYIKYNGVVAPRVWDDPWLFDLENYSEKKVDFLPGGTVWQVRGKAYAARNTTSGRDTYEYVCTVTLDGKTLTGAMLVPEGSNKAILLYSRDLRK